MSSDANSDYHSLLKRAYLEIRRLKGELAAQREEIAVVGMGCRFPGGNSTPEKFHHYLNDGGNAVKPVPADRGDWSRAIAHNSGEVPLRAGFLDSVDAFDPIFFGLSPREAEAMDPQHRLLLTTSWEALERACVTRGDLEHAKAGVFTGIYNSDFAWTRLNRPDRIDAYGAMGMEHAFAPNRISYLLNLKGPSLALNTACSSSLTALHYACASLRTGECDIALAGAVNLILTPLSMLIASRMLKMAPDGQCKTFDARADGVGRGEGCGVLVLKRLSDARAHGDPIQAIIAGTAINEDGRTNVLTAPNGRAQAAVIREALARANTDPGDVGFVETHGTGTPLGDPIEFGALREVYGEGHTPCALGAVKTNLGHLEAASGMAGLFKAIMVLRSGEIPPNLHLRSLNPEIDLQGTRLELPHEPMRFAPAERRIAAVSAFGAGGVNAHAVLRAADDLPSRSASKDDRSKYMLPVSAMTRKSLRGLARSYGDFLLAGNCMHDLRRVASGGRDHYRERIALVASEAREFTELLQAFDEGRTDARIRQGRDVRNAEPVFVYSGQGTEYAGMARDLYESDKTFRASMDECDGYFRGGPSLITGLLDASPGEFKRTRFMQPLLCAVQISLTRVLRELGFQPRAVLGHSLGELAAAWTAGILSVGETMRIARRRGELMDIPSAKGAMAALELSEQEAHRLIKPFAGRLAVAASNAPDAVIISGETSALRELRRSAAGAGVFHRRLRTRYAFHGPAMEGPAGEFQKDPPIESTGGNIAFYSTVTGAKLKGSEFNNAYLARGLRDTVRFADAARAVVRDGYRVFVEIGPRPVLGSYLREIDSVQTFSTLSDKMPDRDALQHLCAGLYCAGLEPDWERLWKTDARKVAAPTYAWHNQSFPLPFTSGDENPPAHQSMENGFAQAPRENDVDDEPDEDTREALEAALDGGDDEEIRAAGLNFINQLLSRTLRMPGDRLDANTYIHRQGVDSLAAAEIRKSLREELGVNVSAVRLLGGIKALELTDLMLAEMRTGSPVEASADQAKTAVRPISSKAPPTPLEAVLMNIFADALGRDEFGLDEVFNGDSSALEKLRESISRRLPFAPPLGELMAAPRPDAMARTIYEMSKRRPRDASFIVRPIPNPDAELRLFCFPHGGGNADFYRDWKIDPRVEMISLQPPGQGERLMEEPIMRMDSYLDLVYREFAPLLTKPWATFGHSMGTLIAYEFARRAARDAKEAPRHMIVSAGPAPDRIEQSLGDLGERSIQEIIRKGIPSAIMDDRELRNLFVPALRGDVARLRDYVYRGSEPLSCDLTVLAGENDELVQMKHSRAWSNFTTGHFDFRLMPGGHHYAYTHRRLLIQTINSIIRKIIG